MHTEATSGTSTEATTKLANETTTEATTKLASETTTEATTKLANETTTEVTTKLANETTTEATTKLANETTTEATTKLANETTTEATTSLPEKTSHSLLHKITNNPGGILVAIIAILAGFLFAEYFTVCVEEYINRVTDFSPLLPRFERWGVNHYALYWLIFATSTMLIGGFKSGWIRNACFAIEGLCGAALFAYYFRVTGELKALHLLILVASYLIAKACLSASVDGEGNEKYPRLKYLASIFSGIVCYEIAPPVAWVVSKVVEFLWNSYYICTYNINTSSVGLHVANAHYDICVVAAFYIVTLLLFVFFEYMNFVLLSRFGKNKQPSPQTA